MRQPFLKIGLLIFLFSTPLLSFGGTIKGFSTSEDFYKVVRGESNSVKIYAGSTYTDCPSTNNTTTCDSCQKWAACTIKGLNGCGDAGPSGFACNRQQIYPDLLFTVNIETTEDLPNCSVPLLAQYSGNKISDDTLVVKTGARTATLQLKWSTICGLTDQGDPSCQTSFANREIQVGVNKDCNSSTATGDTVKVSVAHRYVGGSVPVSFGCSGTKFDSYEGYCYFTVYPGDEKVYITNYGTSSSGALATGQMYEGTNGEPTGSDLSGFKQAAIRVFYQQASSFSGIKIGSSSVDLPLDSTGNLSEDKITGLQNNVPYTFMFANVDEGGNVTNVTDSSNGDNSVTMDATPGFKTTQAATPEKVYGLLDGKNCFIATAAYGSGDAADVELLRKFRNQYLLSWSGGQNFVRFYYQVSPPIANFIAEHESLKFIVRTLLKPFVLLAELMLWGGLPALSAVIMLVIFFLAITFSNNRFSKKFEQGQES